MSLNTQHFSEVLMFISLAAIYLGLAGFLGSLLYRARQRLGWPMQILLFCLTILIFLGISLLVPWNSRMLQAQFLIVYAIILVFSLRPIHRPEWLWRTANGFRYLSVTLILVAIWALSGEFSPVKLMLAPWAFLAAILAWQRSRELLGGETAQTTAPIQPETESSQKALPGQEVAQGERGSV
jgi:hypothetical protein